VIRGAAHRSRGLRLRRRRASASTAPTRFVAGEPAERGGTRARARPGPRGGIALDPRPWIGLGLSRTWGSDPRGSVPALGLVERGSLPAIGILEPRLVGRGSVPGRGLVGCAYGL